MKKLILLSLLFVIWFTLAENFPSFPMSIYGNIKIWITDISAWNIKIYDGSNNELSNYIINKSWKYWAEIATDTALVLNDFSGNIIIKVFYNWITYTVTQDQLDDINKWEWCPDKSWINFVSKNCRYNIVLTQQSWGWGGWGGGWGGGWWGWGWWTSEIISPKPIATWSIITWKVISWVNNPIRTWNTEIQENNDKSFSKEFIDAYSFAYQIWITTQKTIKDADLEWHLIRAHMAKMMTNYAIKIMSGVVDTSRVCEFDDLAGQSDEMKYYIRLSCQLGIMWVGIQSFNPNWPVTRAEFGTVLSRILYGNIYNDWDFFYTNHLKILKEKGIIKNDDPSLEELRWYVMLMLMRVGW